MKILLDTHVWIWSQECPDELGAQALMYLKDQQNSLFISTVSTLEIARLAQAGRIELSGKLGSWVRKSLDYLFCETIVLTHKIAVAANDLSEPFHRDPADRILVATSLCRDLVLMTADERILSYPHIRTIGARA